MPEEEDKTLFYELQALNKPMALIVNKIDNGRGDAAQDSTTTPFHANGHFVVSRGVIIQPKDIKEDS